MRLVSTLIRVTRVYGLTLRPLITFSLFLYMMLENVLISFFYMKLSSFVPFAELSLGGGGTAGKVTHSYCLYSFLPISPNFVVVQFLSHI